MKRGNGPIILYAVLFVITIVSGAAAGEAEKAFQEGTRRFRSGEFEAAADAFRKAHALRPNWKILYNIGQSAAAAKRYGPALEAFERYLVLGGDDIEPGRRDEVLEEIGKLRPIVGAVEIVGPDGLLIRIDDWERGTTPLSGPVLVGGGIDHRLTALLDGKTVFSKVFRVNGEEKTVVELAADVSNKTEPGPSTIENEESTPTHAESTIPDAAGPRKNTPFIVGWTLTGVGAVTLIAAAVTGGLALALDNSIEPACGDAGCPPEKTADRDKMEKLALSTDILIGVGAAAAVTGLVLIGVHALKKKKEKTASTVAYPGIAPGFVGFQLIKEF